MINATVYASPRIFAIRPTFLERCRQCVNLRWKSKIDNAEPKKKKNTPPTPGVKALFFFFLSATSRTGILCFLFSFFFLVFSVFFPSRRTVSLPSLSVYYSSSVSIFLRRLQTSNNKAVNAARVQTTRFAHEPPYCARYRRRTDNHCLLFISDSPLHSQALCRRANTSTKSQSVISKRFLSVPLCPPEFR